MKVPGNESSQVRKFHESSQGVCGRQCTQVDFDSIYRKMSKTTKNKQKLPKTTKFSLVIGQSQDYVFSTENYRKRILVFNAIWQLVDCCDCEPATHRTIIF